MALRTLTSANAVLALSCPDLFAVPQIIQEFSTEDAWSVPQTEIARAAMGVDGRMSGGFVPATKEMDIVLMGNSISKPVFQRIVGTMSANREIFYVDLVLTLLSVQEVWNFTRGIVTKTNFLPPGKKMLDPVSYQITFEDIQPSGI